jgi:transmembrane sensor
MSKKPPVDKTLLDRYVNNHCTEEERRLVLDWLSNPENRLLLREPMWSQWQEFDNRRQEPLEAERLLLKIQEKILPGKLESRKKSLRFFSWKIAAVWSAILLMCVPALIFFKPDERERETNSLADTQTFPRMEAKVSSSSGEIILKVLADGTKIWLNAESSILYPVSFAGQRTREVFLNGEAFFDVAEDKEHPFIVRTRDINIKVLGTAFNVKSYEGDPTVKTTLVRGKVEIQSENGDGEKAVELRPNQQAVFSHSTEKMTLLNVEAENFISWNSGSLVFKNENLYDVVKSLERWYGVAIHIPDETNMDCRLTARIDKESLDQTLEMLQSLTGITYQMEDNKVFIRGNICQQ